MYVQLPLPLTTRQLLQQIIPAAMELLPPYMRSEKADVMLITIALQEADLAHRKQVGGPAVGLWQFERRGGVEGVLTHPTSRLWAAEVCEHFNLPPLSTAIYSALATNDVLACCFARLLLWTDPKPLPATTDKAGSWALYKRTWNPGKPHPEKWWAYHRIAREAIAWNAP
jgi:hypothetical protein